LRPGSVTAVEIPKPGGGLRRLAISSVEDRIVERAVLVELDRVVDPVLSPWSVAYRRGMGVRDAVRALVAARDAGQLFVARADVADCFDSIPRWPVLQRLRELVGDPELVGVVELLVNRPYAGRGVSGSGRRGLLQGSAATPPTHLATCLMVTLRVGVGCGLAVVTGSFPDGDAVADGDFLGSDEDVLDQQPQDASAFFGGRGVCLVVELGKECFQVVGEGEVCVAVGELGVQGVDLVA
jgi:hypothetical protein